MAAPSSVEAVVQEVCSPRWAHSQALTRLRSAQVERQVVMEEMAATLYLMLLLRSVVVVAAPHSMRVHQVGVEAAQDLIIRLVQGLQAKDMEEARIILVERVLVVAVLDLQVAIHWDYKLQTKSVLTADLAMVARPSPFSWMASNTVVVAVVEVQETPAKISQEVQPTLEAAMVVVAIMMPRVLAQMQPTAKEEVEVAAAIIMVVAASPQADQEDQAL